MHACVHFSCHALWEAAPFNPTNYFSIIRATNPPIEVFELKKTDWTTEFKALILGNFWSGISSSCCCCCCCSCWCCWRCWWLWWRCWCCCCCCQSCLVEMWKWCPGFGLRPKLWDQLIKLFILVNGENRWDLIVCRRRLLWCCVVMS